MRGGSSVFRFGPFELDPARGRLFRGPARIPLSNPQAAVLLHLVSNGSAVISKDALMQAAWQDAAVTDNSLKQVISRLRKTLGSPDEPERYIETIPNRGYRFVGTVERAQRHDPDATLDAQLAPFLAFTRGQADLDTLDRDAIVRARRAFEDVLRTTPDYVPALLGLANACALAFESTRVDIAPDIAALQLAIDHARKGCELDPSSAEAWSTLAFALCLSGETSDASAAALKAVALEPLEWRHPLRLSYVSWGEDRLHAARQALALCPRFALAYWLMATVFIARQAFDTALDLLRDGCAAQDAQLKTAAGFPAVGLHLLRGLVLAAVDRVDDAVRELECELASPHGAQLYARECVSNTWYTLGALRLRQRREQDAAAAFRQALTVVPGHIFATAALGKWTPSTRPDPPNTIDSATAQAVALARVGKHPDAARVCAESLRQAPPGIAGWLLAAEPMLNPGARLEMWAETLAILRDRAM